MSNETFVCLLHNSYRSESNNVKHSKLLWKSITNGAKVISMVLQGLILKLQIIYKQTKWAPPKTKSTNKLCVKCAGNIRMLITT
jgi:hypothetical protein